jgi:hypothetical protein
VAFCGTLVYGKASKQATSSSGQQTANSMLPMQVTCVLHADLHWGVSIVVAADTCKASSVHTGDMWLLQVL